MEGWRGVAALAPEGHTGCSVSAHGPPCHLELSVMGSASAHGPELRGGHKHLHQEPGLMGRVQRPCNWPFVSK